MNILPCSKYPEKCRTASKCTVSDPLAGCPFRKKRHRCCVTESEGLPPGQVRCIVDGTIVDLRERDKCPTCGKSYPYWGHEGRLEVD